MSQAHEEMYSSGQGDGASGAAPAGQERPQTLEGDLAVGGNLEKIRTILFGAQSREYEKRFARIEERLSKETADIRDEMRRRFDALEELVKREMDGLSDRVRAEENERSVSLREAEAQLREADRALSDRLKAEQGERADALRELTGELHRASGALERRIAQVDDMSVKAQRELRDQLLAQSKSLSEEIRAKTDELSAALGQAVRELRSEKTDRSALAAMLSELAMRLNDEFKITADE